MYENNKKHFFIYFLTKRWITEVLDKSTRTSEGWITAIVLFFIPNLRFAPRNRLERGVLDFNFVESCFFMYID